MGATSYGAIDGLNPSSSSQSRAPSGCAAGCGCFTLLMVLMVVAGVAMREPGLATVGVVLGTLSLGLTLYFLTAARQASTVAVQVTISPLQVRFGERVKVQVQVLAKRRIRLTTGTIALRCRERAINRGGTTDSTYLHMAHDDARPITAETELSEGMAWSIEESFELPAGLPASYSGRNNFIEWHAFVALGIKGPIPTSARPRFEVLPESPDPEREHGNRSGNPFRSRPATLGAPIYQPATGEGPCDHVPTPMREHACAVVDRCAFTAREQRTSTSLPEGFIQEGGLQAGLRSTPLDATCRTTPA